MERPEAMDSGHIVLTGLEPETILNAVRFVVAQTSEERSHTIPEAYSVQNTSARVVKLILGTAGLSHLWEGIQVA
jgi:UDP-N-acetylglucosamine 2-epimerase (non-hydrolysing)